MPKDVGDLTKGPGFVPILRSKLQLRSDLTVKQQASYSDAFFLTMVHEFGHTLGLQHSTVSATMSTSTDPRDDQGAAAGAGRYRRHLACSTRRRLGGHHRQHHRPGSAKRERSEHGERGRAVLERNGDCHADQPRRQLSHRRDSAGRLLRLYPAAASAAARREHAGGHRPALGFARRHVRRLYRLRRTVLPAHARLAAGGHHHGDSGSQRPATSTSTWSRAPAPAFTT